MFFIILFPFKIVFINSNRGVVFGRKTFQMPLAEIGWATLSRRGSFNPEDGFVGCPRQNETYMYSPCLSIKQLILSDQKSSILEVAIV
jgi:hypothetical protein